MEITTRELSYHTDEGLALLSHLALPEDISTPVGAVIVAPEWWGLSEHPKNTANKLAEKGYAALAIDVYGDGETTTNAAQANDWMQALLNDQDELLARATLGFKQLKHLPETAPDKIAAVGFCFGGKIVLDMARSGLALKAVGTFHGNPAPYQKAEPDSIKGELLIAHGEEDSMVPMDAITTLKQELTAANANFHIDVYPGAKHGFTNPAVDERAKENDIDLKYNEQAATQSWQKFIDLLERTIGAD